jgi:hypothetical protein
MHAASFRFANTCSKKTENMILEKRRSTSALHPFGIRKTTPQ